MAPTACRGRGNTRCGYPLLRQRWEHEGVGEILRGSRQITVYSRFNEFLVRAQRLVACRSIATRQRSCPGSLQQIRQCCDHENHIGARSHPDLWATPCGAAERAPCCERGGEDRIRPTISAPGQHEKAAGSYPRGLIQPAPIALPRIACAACSGAI